MTDKERKQTKDRIRKCCKEWLKPLGFGWFDIKIVFCDEPPSDKPTNWLARTHTLWQYRMARITWNLSAIAEISDKTLRICLFHELAHILVAQMREIGDQDQDRKHEDFVCTHIERLVDYAYHKGLRDGRKRFESAASVGRHGCPVQATSGPAPD